MKNLLRQKTSSLSKLSTNKDISVPVNGNKFFNKHIAIVGSTGSVEIPYCSETNSKCYT